MANNTDVHAAVSCDVCSTTGFRGNRYKCLRCSDYDLCQYCFRSKRFGDPSRTSDIVPHDETHPMQLMLTEADFELVYEGDTTREYSSCKIITFTCPYCCQFGFNYQTFGAHVTATHGDPPSYNVICPVCLATPEMEHSVNRDTENLKAHWIEFHANKTEALRPEPSRANVRRPMLARRVGRPAPVTRSNPSEHIASESELEEWLRAMRTGQFNTDPNRPLQSLNFLTPGTIERQMRRVIEQQQHPMTSEYAQPRVVSTHGSTLASQNASQNQTPVIRPVRLTPVYPQSATTEETEATDDESRLWTESDEDYDNETANDEESSEEDDVPSVKVVGEQPRNLSDPSSSDGEDDEETNEEKEDWKGLEQILSAEEVQLLKKSLKENHPMVCEDDEEAEQEVQSIVKRPQPAKLIAQTEGLQPRSRIHQQQQTTQTHPTFIPNQAEDGVQSWLGLAFDVPPHKSIGTGKYWVDKQFLRTRKLRRDMSAASEDKDNLEKGDVALAICTAGLLGDNPVTQNLNMFDHPDKSIKEALRNCTLDEDEPSSSLPHDSVDDPSIKIRTFIMEQAEKIATADLEKNISEAVEDEPGTSTAPLALTESSDNEDDDDETAEDTTDTAAPATVTFSLGPP